MTDKKGFPKIQKEQLMDFFKRIFSGRKKNIIIGLLIILLGLAGFSIFTKKEKTPELQTTLVERGMIISSVSASGKVLSVNIMSANTQASGIVKTVYVKDGDKIKKGDKILEIDLDFQGEQKNAQAWSSYLSAKNNLESAKVNQYSLQVDMFGKWDTFKEFAEGDGYEEGSVNRNLPEFHIPEKEWLAAEAKYKNQQAVIVQTQVAINSAWLTYIQASPTITAPMDGVITSLMYAEGMSIGVLDTGNTTSNQKVATIKTEGMPIVLVNLSEIDVSLVEIGQKTTIIIDSIPDKTFTGKLIGVDRIGQTDSGVTQYPAIIQLDSSSKQILPNMAVTANIVINRKDNVLLVPSGVVQNNEGQSYVNMLVGGQPQSIPVEVGLSSDTQTEIVSGLNEGDLVVSGSIFSTESEQAGTSPFGGADAGGMMRMIH
ncbi:efflux RND transporter periplasmic adaptor subunit [Patescibacteria group bacterium]|nr:efflux RND transporter periplasmic adaptor subunit [Patescibacteria group bacterium]